MFRMFVLGAVTLSAWSIALERPNSEAQACRRRCGGGCYSNGGCGSGYGYASNYNYGNSGYASYGNSCGRSRCCHRGHSSCGAQYTTASTCGGSVNQCGYTTPTYTDGTIAPQPQAQPYGAAEDVAPPPAPNANTTAPQPPPAPTPAPAPGRP
jgi:hypothetical protein